MTYQPQVAASAGHLKSLQKTIAEQSVRCILTEPQFESRTVRSAVSDNNIQYATVDPLASNLPSGADLYRLWLLDTSATIRDCLNQPGGE